ncbi:MAG: zinc-ribbon domain-containing protein, partial [Clostridiales bacterium]|nr:zinc-ribbon domain-containing protein [Candidatus Apopatousia equi]
MKKCSVCGNEMKDDMLYCSKCGSCQDGKLHCENCGSEVKEDDSFCSVCGEPVGKFRKVCRTCGYELQENSNFCPKCGNQRNNISNKSKKQLKGSA